MKIINHLNEEKTARLIAESNFERLNNDELGKVRGGTSDPPITSQ